jgi:hypothetical protein
MDFIQPRNSPQVSFGSGKGLIRAGNPVRLVSDFVERPPGFAFGRVSEHKVLIITKVS